MKTKLIVALALALNTLSFHVTLGGEQAGERKAAKLDTQVNVQLGYLLYLPKDYHKQEPWPLLLFLHGSGERGDDLELVKKHGPPKLIAAGKDFQFIVVSPQCPKNHWWEPIELVALLDDIFSEHKVDANRIYVTATYDNPKFYEWLLEQKRSSGD